ncbi:MAG: 2-hydroxyacid dehydrogenase [Gemmatimonadota bacterium]
MTTRPTVTATRRLPAAVEDQLGLRYDARLNAHDRPLDAGELREALASSDALLCTVTDRLDAGVLAAEPLRARILASFGVGFDHIDLDAARTRGLRVTNTPDVLTDDTADLAVTLMLMACRRAGEGERHVRANAWSGWRPTHMLGTRVTGKTLGLVGMGRIARAVARRAKHGFGMRVLFQDPNPPPPEVAAELGAESRGTLEELLEAADVVSLHCPATPETHHLIDDGALARMKPSAILVNTARGDVVDEAALVRALRDGRIAGAGLDVYEREPRVPDALRALENVVLLPHLGSATLESRVAMGLRAIENLDAFFSGAPLRDAVV